jgi:phenylalanyl-tRNA synthetase beta chain
LRANAKDVPDVALFEVGSVFLAREGEVLPAEPTHVAGVLAGSGAAWLKPGEPVDFFDAKGVVEHLFGELLGVAAASVRFEATADVPYLHPGVAAEIRLGDGTRIGEVGEVHPETREALGVEVACFGFEIDLSLVPAPSPAQMSAITKYPAITRDISFFVAAEVPSARVHGLIAGAEEALLERVQVLEDYRDPEKVPAGQKGMLWSITYRAGDRTLTDAEVDRAHEAIVGRLLADLPAERR